MAAVKKPVTKTVTLAEVLDAAETDPTPKVKFDFIKTTKTGRTLSCFIGGAALNLGVDCDSLLDALSEVPALEGLPYGGTFNRTLASQVIWANDSSASAKKNIAKAVRKRLAADELAKPLTVIAR